MEYLELVFEQYQVSDKNYICVTRNADIAPDDEALADNEDFRYIMKETLHKRRKMAVVRLETAAPLGKEMEKYFCDRFKITPECIFRTKMPMKLGFIFAIADKIPRIYEKSADRRAVYTSACRCACRRDQRDGAGETQRCFVVLSI